MSWTTKGDYDYRIIIGNPVTLKGTLADVFTIKFKAGPTQYSDCIIKLTLDWGNNNDGLYKILETLKEPINTKYPNNQVTEKGLFTVLDPYKSGYTTFKIPIDLDGYLSAGTDSLYHEERGVYDVQTLKQFVNSRITIDIDVIGMLSRVVNNALELKLDYRLTDMKIIPDDYLNS